MSNSKASFRESKRVTTVAANIEQKMDTSVNGSHYGIANDDKAAWCHSPVVNTMSQMAYFIPAEAIVTAEAVVALLADRLVRYHG